MASRSPSALRMGLWAAWTWSATSTAPSCAPTQTASTRWPSTPAGATCCSMSTTCSAQQHHVQLSQCRAPDGAGCSPSGAQPLHAAATSAMLLPGWGRWDTTPAFVSPVLPSMRFYGLLRQHRPYVLPALTQSCTTTVMQRTVLHCLSRWHHPRMGSGHPRTAV